MNLVISLPVGVVIIVISYLMLVRYTQVSRYMLAAMLAVFIVAVYSFIAAINWPGVDVYAIHLAVYLISVYAMSIIFNKNNATEKLHWGPKLIFSFFAIVIIVNSVLVYLAQTGMSSQLAKIFLPEPKKNKSVQSVFPGVVSHDFRERESQFNIYQQQRLTQKLLGWTVTRGWLQVAVANTGNTFIVSIKNKNERMLKDARVEVQFLYPANMKDDQVYTLSIQENGLYSTTVNLPRPGTWDVIINIHHPDGEFEIRSKTKVKPAV